MTMALCFNCGETKFGAICPCSNCQVGSTGNIELDIAFSDHNYSVATLEQLGGVIKEINTHCDDPKKCFWAFIHYVSENHPEILRVDLDADVKPEIESIVAKCTFPNVVVEESHERRFMQDHDDSARTDADGA